MNTEFDAIVIGSGITGGWAAKELTEKGLSVLVLERGRNIKHGADYQGEHLPPWEFKHRGRPDRELNEREYEVQSRAYAFSEANRQFWNNDRDNPYQQNPDKPFLWQRADVVGGRSLLWGRQSYRWSEQDFEANKRDGHSIDWPIRYHDLAQWYSYVENHIGISGQAEGLAALPDSEFIEPMALNIVEKEARKKLKQHFGRTYTIGRTAILTEPRPGRGTCHYCGPCENGCSVGAYFSTQSSTLPAAEKTGKLTLLPDSLVHSIEYDENAKRASAVRVIDTKTGEKKRYTSRIVFLCASTVASAQILLNSRSKAFPNGLANSSGVIGHYLMDHMMGPGALGTIPGFTDYVEQGRRPTGGYIPRFRNLGSTRDSGLNFDRGFGYQVYINRTDLFTHAQSTAGFGADFKHALRKPGPWQMFVLGYSECLPRFENKVSLVESKPDRFGIPQVKFDFSFGNNELNMIDDMAQQASDMIQAVGGVNIDKRKNTALPGEAIHEMGTVRMGNDPSTSALNGFNQSHDVPNLFVTDGSCMTSSSCVNPSLTYMALTARAADAATKMLAENRI